MEKSNLPTAYQIAQLRRHSAQRRRGKVTTWEADIPGVEPFAPWWTGPLGLQRGHWPATRPTLGFCHPVI
jgi:hypothetical protein